MSIVTENLFSRVDKDTSVMQQQFGNHYHIYTE